MARGFWTGLLHGGVVSIAAVAALSLAAPLPRSEPAVDPVPAAAPVEPQPSPVPATLQPQASDAPQAGAVHLPVGSEFGRGGDMAPRLPTPLSSERPAQAEAPAVVAPTSEPAPVAVMAADPRPQPAGEQDGPVQAAPAAGEDAPRLVRPVSLPQPAVLTVPERAAADAPDIAPAVPSDLSAAEPDQTPKIPTPSLPAPALDLSLPPDLSDLQGLARD